MIETDEFRQRLDDLDIHSALKFEVELTRDLHLQSHYFHPEPAVFVISVYPSMVWVGHGYELISRHC